MLGAAAGGGSPQWNCRCRICRRVRAGDPGTRPRTQCCVAVSADDERWILLNASPDLREQIERTPALQPRRGMRSSPIASVLLTSGEVDAIAGLLTLRERQAFTLYAPTPVLDVLEANSVFEVLARDVVPRSTLQLETPHAIALPSGVPTGLTAVPFAVPGKVPLYLEGPDQRRGDAGSGDTIGLAIGDGSTTLFFIPACAAMTPELAARLRGADAVLFDATLWRDDELIREEIGAKTGRRMGHMSVSGPDGTLAALAGIDVRTRVLLHVNNSNPILLDTSPERAEVEQAGWTVAWDGMELRL